MMLCGKIRSGGIVKGRSFDQHWGRQRLCLCACVPVCVCVCVCVCTALYRLLLVQFLGDELGFVRPEHLQTSGVLLVQYVASIMC